MEKIIQKIFSRSNFLPQIHFLQLFCEILVKKVSFCVVQNPKKAIVRSIPSATTEPRSVLDREATSCPCARNSLRCSLRAVLIGLQNFGRKNIQLLSGPKPSKGPLIRRVWTKKKNHNFLSGPKKIS